MSKTSKSMREDKLFLRNEYQTVGKYQIPLIKKQNVDIHNCGLIAYSETKAKDSEFNKQNGVHFFIDDYRMESPYKNPSRCLAKIFQYKFVLSPDYSLYADMQFWKQIENVAKNRWVGAFWQSQGLNVVPTISWGLSNTFEFCFDGIETNSIVAVATIGCKHSRSNFMRGYNEMLVRIKPCTILVYGTPFTEMQGNIIPFAYRNFESPQLNFLNTLYAH